jgi:hypothetical protein
VAGSTPSGFLAVASWPDLGLAAIVDVLLAAFNATTAPDSADALRQSVGALNGAALSGGGTLSASTIDEVRPRSRRWMRLDGVWMRLVGVWMRLIGVH